MFCKNCGKELPDSAKFCSGCGAPVAPAEPQPAAQEPVVPAETPSPAGVPEPAAPAIPTAVAAPERPERAEEPVDPVVEAPGNPPVAEPGESAKKRRGASGVVVLGVAAVVAVVLVVALFKLISGLMGGGSRAQAFAYLNDDYELMYLADLSEKTEALEISDDMDSSAGVQFSADGKTLYFRDNKNALYKIAVADLKKGGRPERISRDVLSFTVLKTGDVLYAKSGSGGNRELNCYNGTDDFRITKNYETRQLSEDQKTVYYTERDEDDGTLTLYKAALKKDAQSEKLLDGATEIYTSFDSSVLVYGENDRNAAMTWSDEVDQNTLTVYSCKPGGEATELIDDIYSVGGVKVDGGKVSFYYMVEDLERYTLYDLVSDAQQSADAAAVTQEPVWPDWYSAYSPSEIFVDGNTAYYRDGQGQAFPIDTSSLQAAPDTPVTDLSYYAVYDLAYADAQERYNSAIEDYNAKFDVWNAANNRSNIREQLKNENYTQSSFSLYRYTGSETAAPLAASLNESWIFSSYEDGVFLYKKAAGVTGDKVCDVSDLSYYGEIYDYLNRDSGGDDWYQNVGGTESVFELDGEASIVGFYVLNGKELVLDLYEDGERRLDAYTVGGTTLGFSNTILDDEAYSGLRQGKDAKDNDVLCFFTDVESDSYGVLGDFNRYSSGKTEVLAKEVYTVWCLSGSDTLYAVTDRDRNGSELSLIQSDKPVSINDEYDYNTLIFLDAKQVLYTADGDLYLWNGKEERRIARDVEYVWASAKEDYAAYSPSY